MYRLLICQDTSYMKEYYKEIRDSNAGKIKLSDCKVDSLEEMIKFMESMPTKFPGKQSTLFIDTITMPLCNVVLNAHLLSASDRYHIVSNNLRNGE